MRNAASGCVGWSVVFIHNHLKLYRLSCWPTHTFGSKLQKRNPAKEQGSSTTLTWQLDPNMTTRPQHGSPTLTWQRAFSRDASSSSLAASARAGFNEAKVASSSETRPPTKESDLAAAYAASFSRTKDADVKTSSLGRRRGMSALLNCPIPSSTEAWTDDRRRDGRGRDGR